MLQVLKGKDIKDESLREKLPASKYFVVDSEIGNTRDEVFNYAMK